MSSDKAFGQKPLNAETVKKSQIDQQIDAQTNKPDSSRVHATEIWLNHASPFRLLENLIT